MTHGKSPSDAIAHGRPNPEPKSLRERMAAFWRENPVPPQTGQVADKAFFDELSGETPG